MTDADYQKARVIRNDLDALACCTIPAFASEELKQEFIDWVKEKRTSLQDEFVNL